MAFIFHKILIRHFLGQSIFKDVYLTWARGDSGEWVTDTP